MSLFSDGLRSIRKAGWAPIAVLVLHQICIKAGWRAHSDGLLHFSGGLAIAYFLYYAIGCFSATLGQLSRIGRLALTFCSAATVAVFWDLAEFASDQVLSTDIQHSLIETMLDLSFGVGGAAVSSLLLFLLARR